MRPTRGAWILGLAAGCADPAVGLLATPAGSGPMVVVDWDKEPLPELPFPNDLATIVDASSPTGMRVNIPTKTKTDYESEARHKLDELTGWGIYAPITVTFDAPIDLDNVIARHPDDFHTEAPFADDAFYVIDVTEGSPDYGKPVALDVGHGRYPVDVFQTDRYFPNDPRSDSQSLLFELGDEDLNDNGELDPGEDVDNDGILDFPNVWPDGADPTNHLLSWYDRQTNTLIVRPALPLREETTYAVVLTRRLVGEDGEPIRSPWPFVHHTRQTGALEPVPGLLSAINPELGLNDVAFAWTFTTGRVTGDLVDLHEAVFKGAGPFAKIASEYPAGVTEALSMQAADGMEAFNLSTSRLLDILVTLGALEIPNPDLVLAAYRQYSDRLVTGAFTTPYLLVDRDDGGRDDADERWQLDPMTGAYVAGPQRVPFTCVLPKPQDGVAQPYPVMLYGHGYGSNRLEVLYFGYALNRLGWAVCSLDFPGHGVESDNGTLQLAEELLGAQGLRPVIQSLGDHRARDLDNDGSQNSGGDQWASDPFHTRDMVRQGVLDWMQMVKSLQACGSGTMQLVEYQEDDTRLPNGQTQVSCDWDGDGTPDIGGGASISISGGSLGGINSGVAAAVIPEVSSFTSVVPGGGIVDIGIRTEIGGAVEAFVGRLMTPLILGYPEGEGLRLVQMVTSVTNMRELTIATLPTIPAGGTILIENLRSGEVREGLIPDDGRLRVAIAADAMDAAERAIASGMPFAGPEPEVVYEVPDNDGLGDPLLIEVYDADGHMVASIDTWESDVVFEGVTMRAGSPLVAAADGNGKIRGSEQARRVATVMAMVLEPGDPIAYAPHYHHEPLAALGGQPANVLIMPNPGDPIVPTSTGIAMARAARIVSTTEVDPRYGMTTDRLLIERGVVRGIEERGPYTDGNGVPLLFDVDDLDQGTDGSGAPSEATPLRATVTHAGGQSGLRLPYAWPQGVHGFKLDSTLPFDWTNYVLHLVGDYTRREGAEISDRLCLMTADCDDFPPVVRP